MRVHSVSFIALSFILFSSALYTTTTTAAPDSTDDLPEVTMTMTTTTTPGDLGGRNVTRSEGGGGAGGGNKTWSAGEEDVDQDLGLETRSFHSSKRKNKISDNRWKIKEKKVKHPDSKMTAADLTDDLEDWEAPEEMQKNYPYYLAGYDNEDRPLWVAEYGRFDIREKIEEGVESQALLDKYVKQCAMRIVRSVRERNNEVGDVTGATVILDLDGLSLYQVAHPPTLVFVLRLVRIYAELVDANVENAIVINTNYIAETLINLVRPLFGRMMEKVDIYGTQPSKWRPALRQLIPPESIPSWYGGVQGFKPIRVYG